MFGIHELPKAFSDGTELEGQRVYHASKKSVAEATIEGCQLLVKGLHVDCVARLSTIAEDEVGISTETSWTPRTWKINTSLARLSAKPSTTLL